MTIEPSFILENGNDIIDIILLLNSILINNPLSANFTKWSNTLKTIRGQFADELCECV